MLKIGKIPETSTSKGIQPFYFFSENGLFLITYSPKREGRLYAVHFVTGNSHKRRSAESESSLFRLEPFP